MIALHLKDYVIEKSQELEIDIIGFTNTEPFHNIGTILLERKSKGYETEFEEKIIEERVYPQRLLGESKTIIVIGISYNVDYTKGNRGVKKGRISRSSLGIDYHKVLKNKMELLVEEIYKITEFKYRYFVDTGPLVDREVAKRAGIGWYGKNCSIINDKFGSFIFIGYILTDLEIEFDQSSKGECGKCTLCIDACPTGAIEEGYRLNPKKCISYLTQTKEKIPYDLRGKMGIKIYGCDTCQLVCHRNKSITKGTNQSFIPHADEDYLDIEELFHLSNREFQKKYGHMAGSWRGKKILKRNGIIALGNMGDKGAIPLLKAGLEDSDSMIREYSAWALLKIDRDFGRRIIIEHLDKEVNEKVKEELHRLIEYFKGDKFEDRNNC